MAHFRTLLLLLLPLSLGACGTTTASGASGDDAGTTDAAGDATATASILGVWSSAFGGYEAISATLWDEATVVQFDAEKRFAITKNPITDKYAPSKFNKLAWTAPQADAFYLCTVDFGLDTAELAAATTKTADDSAPDTKGCGGFSWTKLTATAPLAIVGKYKDNFGGGPVITNRFWDASWIVKYDNTKRFAITQNPADDKFSPSKFNKIIWTEPVAGSFYSCTIAYGQDSAELAEKSSETADSSAPEKSGCGGFAWSKLTAQ